MIVPAAVAMAVCSFRGDACPRSIAVRHASALGFAAGFLAGYALLPDWAEMIPSRHWHWLVYLGAAAALTGPIALAGGVSPPNRWLLQGLLATVAAWLIVPTWASAPAVACRACAGAGRVLRPSGDRGRWAAGSRFGTDALHSMCVAAAGSAATIAAFVSLTYATLAGLAAAALAGTCLASWRRSDPLEIRGLIPAYAIVVGGAAFVAEISPSAALAGDPAHPCRPSGTVVLRALQAADYPAR